MVSSGSSCFGRLERPLPFVIDEAGREEGSLFRGADSDAGESGDLEVLVEAEGAERLPERRVSRGESGGPIVAAWAMTLDQLEAELEESLSVRRVWIRVCPLSLHLFRAGNNTVISSSSPPLLSTTTSPFSPTRPQPGNSVGRGCPVSFSSVLSSPAGVLILAHVTTRVM